MYIFVNLTVKPFFNNFRRQFWIKYLRVCGLPCCWGYFSNKLELYQLVSGNQEIGIFNAFTEDFTDKKGSKFSIRFKYFNWYIFSGSTSVITVSINFLFKSLYKSFGVFPEFGNLYGIGNAGVLNEFLLNFHK